MGLAPTPALEWFSLLWARKGQGDIAGRCPFEPELRLQSKESNTCKALTPKRRRKLGLYAILWALDRSRTRLEFPGSPGIKTMIFHCTRHKFDSWLKNWISHAAAQLEKKKVEQGFSMTWLSTISHDPDGWEVCPQGCLQHSHLPELAASFEHRAPGCLDVTVRLMSTVYVLFGDRAICLRGLIW